MTTAASRQLNLVKQLWFQVFLAMLAGILLGWTLAPPRLPNLLALSKRWVVRQ